MSKKSEAPKKVIDLHDENTFESIKIGYPAEAEQIKAVSENGHAIQAIIERCITLSEAVQLAAVKQCGWAIRHLIKDKIIPSEFVQIASVKQNGYAIQCIMEGGITPSEAVQLAAVEQCPWAIQFLIENKIIPSNAVYLSVLVNDSFIQNDVAYYNFVNEHFKDKPMLINKWLRYAENIRDMME